MRQLLARVRGWFARLVSDRPLRDKHPRCEEGCVRDE